MTPQEALKHYFGHDAFRPGQEAVIGALLQGRDVLAVMPTGAGKSICYQVPALLMPGITLVISPLISLMQDQVLALIQSGVPAAYINSGLTVRQTRLALERAAQGQYKLIYAAPERLESADFLAFALNAPLSLVVVDEAHCVSQWGQDFRPSYTRIAGFVEKLGVRPPVAAFTATATHQVRQDIQRLLALHSPFCLTTGFNRPNLYFAVEAPKDPYTALLRHLAALPDASGIVYCATRKGVEDVVRRLRREGLSAAGYHAGMTDEARRESQESFQYDRVRILVATNAFGMGIDKSNVSFVIHYNLPRSPESYYQEAGRAGRDGSPALCLLFYAKKDVALARWMIENGEGNPALTPAQRAAVRLQDLERLHQMTCYATSNRCLRGFLLNYFGESAPVTCGACSVCAPRFAAAAEKSTLPEKGEDSTLYARLKAVRMQLAQRSRVPAYMIFSNETLLDMARKKPRNETEFLQVNGVGETKLRRYAAPFLAVLTGKESASPSPSRSGGKRQGSRWSQKEEVLLKKEFEDGDTVPAMARAHGRSAGAIWARLKALGLAGEADTPQEFPED